MTFDEWMIFAENLAAIGQSSGFLGELDDTQVRALHGVGVHLTAAANAELRERDPGITPTAQTYADGAQLDITRVAGGWQIRSILPPARQACLVADAIVIPDDELPAHLRTLVAALRRLVTADNCGYLRDTMRYEGYFEAARAALRETTGEDLTPGVQLHDARSIYDALLTASEQVLRRIDQGYAPYDKLDQLRDAIRQAHAARAYEM